MTGHAQPSGIARRQAWAAAFLAAASALAVLILSSRSAWSSQATPVNSTSQTTGTYQVELQVGAGAFAYDLPEGTSVTLPISVTVTGPQPLTAASVLLQYDPAVLQPTGCVPRTGAPAGFCNPAFDPESGLIRFNLLSGSGVMGEVGLFDLTFATASGAVPPASSSVAPLIESLADAQGNYMTSRTQGSTISILTGTGSGVVVYVGAPDQAGPLTVSQGLTTTVPIWVSGVTNLGSATFALAFDPAVVRPLACRPYATTGYGDASGLCALHPDHVSANLIASGGLSGSVLAFETVFTTAANAAPGSSSALDIIIEALADTGGAPIQARARNNAIVVAATGGAPVPLLRIAPTTQNLDQDARVTVHVFVDGGDHVRAASWGVRYDPLVLIAETCELSAGLTNGACNASAGPGLVRMNLLSTEALDPGVDVGAITFRRHPEAKKGRSSALTLDVTNFADLAGTQLPYRTQNAIIKIREALDVVPAVVLSLAGAPRGGFNLARGASLDVPIVVDIDPQQPIGSLIGELRYDPAVLRPTRCVRRDSISDENPPMGYCNAQYDRIQGIVRFNLLSADGVSGSLTPFTLTVEAASAASDGQTSPLNLALETVTGPLGEARTYRAEDSKIRLQPPVPAPRVLIGSPGPQSNGIYSVTLGYTTTVPVWVDGVTNLGAASLAISYNPAVARAVKCTVRSDLIPEIDGGFCAAPPGTGIIRANVLAQSGFSGTGQFYDIVFAQAPNMIGGESTPITVTVDNFVSAAEIPIPTTVQAGRLDNVCPLPPPVESIALPDRLKLSWLHIALDTCAKPVPVAYYEIWRDSAPYTVTSSAPIGQVTVPPGTPAGTAITFALEPPTPEEGLRVYRIVAVPARRQPSDYSNTQGAFSYRLVTGSSGAR